MCGGSRRSTADAEAQILEFDRMISAWHRSNETSRRLDKAPGIGPVLATALVATVCRPQDFPIRAQLLGLDWAGAEAAFERGQGQVWPYQQAR